MKRSYYANIKFSTTEDNHDEVYEYEDIYNFGDYHFEADDERYIADDLKQIASAGAQLASAGEKIKVIGIKIKKIPQDEIEKVEKDLLDKWNAAFEARRKEVGLV